MAAVALLGVTAARTMLDRLWFGGLLILLAAIIAAPPLRTKLQSIVTFRIPGIAIGIVSLGLFVQGIILAGENQRQRSQEVERAAEAAMKARVAEKLASIDSDFRTRKFEILSDAQSKFDSGDLSGAKSALVRFSQIQDPDLVRLRIAVFGIVLKKELEQNLSEERRAAVFTELQTS